MIYILKALSTSVRSQDKIYKIKEAKIYMHCHVCSLRRRRAVSAWLETGWLEEGQAVKMSAVMAAPKGRSWGSLS